MTRQFFTLFASLAALFITLSVSSPAEAKFLQVDPIGYKDNMNLYTYVSNDPMNLVDPDGQYGRGKGWTDKQWKKFNKMQKKLAKRIKGKQASWRKKAAKLRAKGKDAKADKLDAKANSLNGIASALESDGSDGFMASVATSMQDYKAAGGKTSSGFAIAPIKGKTITFNGTHNSFFGGKNYSNRVMNHSIVHEAAHNMGHFHRYLPSSHALSGSIPYLYGNKNNVRAFNIMKRSYPGLALQNPDHIAASIF